LCGKNKTTQQMRMMEAIAMEAIAMDAIMRRQWR